MKKTVMALTQVMEYIVPSYTTAFTMLLDPASQVLSVRVQDGNTYMYILEPSGGGSKKDRPFFICSTSGYGITDLSKFKFIGTFKSRDGQPVQHLFDATPPPEPPGPMEQLAECFNET